MTVQITPYLSFRSNAADAMASYRSVFGGDLTVRTFAEFHASDDPAEADKVMHAMLVSPNGLVLMASDTPNAMEYRPGNNFSVSLGGGADDAAELRGYWDKLLDGAVVDMALSPAPWGDTFGMCTDRFGIRWLVNIAGHASWDA